MDRWVGKVALVTGASAGIGAALVRKLVSEGVNVAACARDLDKLKVHNQMVKCRWERI